MIIACLYKQNMNAIELIFSVPMWQGKVVSFSLWN